MMFANSCRVSFAAEMVRAFTWNPRWAMMSRLNSIAMFWTAYILTRPLGASFADWMGVSPVRGGLNWGPGNVAMLLTGAKDLATLKSVPKIVVGELAAWIERG